MVSDRDTRAQHSSSSGDSDSESSDYDENMKEQKILLSRKGIYIADPCHLKTYTQPQYNHLRILNLHSRAVRA